MNISVQDVNHAASGFGFAALTFISDNLFEVIGAIGVLVNIVFVVRSHYLKKAEHAAKMEREAYEIEILKRKLNEVA